MSAPSPVLGALCCECGNYRTGVSGWRHTTAWPAPEDEAYARQRLAELQAELAANPNRRTIAIALAYWQQILEHLYENTTCDLKCPNCGKVTRHAVVRTPTAPDYYEEANRDHDARPIGSAEVLKARGVEVVEVPTNLAAGGVGGLWVREVRVVLVRAGMSPEARERTLSRMVAYVQDHDRE